jgi:hypothetical protein
MRHGGFPFEGRIGRRKMVAALCGRRGQKAIWPA